MRVGKSDLLADEVVVLDFETTGLSSEYHRVIEVGAVVVRDGTIVDSFSQLMNPDQYIPYFISNLTGITNEMVEDKPSPQKVMPKLKKFIGKRPIVAHNASFDYKFLRAEMSRARIKVNNPMLCTMLLSRRLIPSCSSYRLGSIARHLNIKAYGLHRALSDVNVTAQIWDHLYRVVSEETGIEKPETSVFLKISKTPKKSVNKYLSNKRSQDSVER